MKAPRLNRLCAHRYRAAASLLSAAAACVLPGQARAQVELQSFTECLGQVGTIWGRSAIGCGPNEYRSTSGIGDPLVPGQTYSRKVTTAVDFSEYGAEVRATVTTSRATRADYGSLGVAVSVDMVSSITDVPGSDPPLYPGLFGMAAAKASFSDLLSITSSTLAPGATVSVGVKLALTVQDATLSNVQAWWWGYSTYSVQVGFALHEAGGSGIFVGGLSLFTQCDNSPNPYQFGCFLSPGQLIAATLPVDLQVGQSYVLTSDLRADVVTAQDGGEEASPYTQHRTGTTLFSSLQSAHLTLEGGTDFAVSTSSGARYGLPSPVPEPGSWALMGMGLLVLAMRRQRDLRSRRQC